MIQSIGEVLSRDYPRCKEPGCCNAPGASGYCVKHGIKVKKITKIKPVSDKRKVLNRDLAKLVKKAKAETPECSIKSPVCTGRTETLNHIQKRSPNNLTDPDNLEECCYACNGYVEQFPQWSKENGHHKIR